MKRLFSAGLMVVVVSACADDDPTPGITNPNATTPNATTPNASNATTPNATAPNAATANSNAPVVAVDDVLPIGPQGGVLDVLANDSGSGVLTITATTAANRGEVTLQGNALTYTPPANYNGLDSFTYTVEGSDSSATATVFVTTYDTYQAGAPAVELPDPPGLTANEIAVVINTADPYSVEVGEHYASARGLAADAVIRVELPLGNRITRDEFAPIRQQIIGGTPERIQAYALAWIAPFRVDCMSMTSAVALGFDERYCGIGSGCQQSAAVDYYNSYSDDPLADHQLRPAMMLALNEQADGIALVDRGIAADRTFPTDTGHLFRTTDTARSVRYPDFASIPDRWASDGFTVVYTDNSDGSGSNTLSDATDVLFYFTGLTSVGGLDTLTFRPGAAADHLTSFGGRLTATSGQMPATRFLEAGATASYGTVVEPCNYQQKFPRASTFLDHYFRGETLIEAYWKSVNWPGEGVFIGEPLARPFGRVFLDHQGDTLTYRLSWLVPGRSYQLEGSDTAVGPWAPVGESVTRTAVGIETFEVSPVEHQFYRLTTPP